MNQRILRVAFVCTVLLCNSLFGQKSSATAELGSYQITGDERSTGYYSSIQYSTEVLNVTAVGGLNFANSQYSMSSYEFLESYLGLNYQFIDNKFLNASFGAGIVYRFSSSHRYNGAILSSSINPIDLRPHVEVSGNGTIAPYLKYSRGLLNLETEGDETFNTELIGFGLRFSI